MIVRAITLLLASIAITHSLAWVVQAQTPETASTIPSGVISGRVTSAAGDLPNNTIVYVSAAGGVGPPRSTVVNSNGTFKVDGLEIAVYRVWAGAPGFVADVPQLTSETRGLYHTGDIVNIALRKGGVISGKVLSVNNAPAVAISVRAFRIRDENGKPTEITSSSVERMTDDRGVYRIYGLPPGTYVVSAGGSSRFFGGFGTTGYDQDAPTYSPSSTRDTATEVSVGVGEEATADIQYRGEPGHSVSGTVGGIALLPSGMSYSGTISLTDVKTRTILMSTNASSANNYNFAFYGLSDGEYELAAQQFSQSRDIRASEPKRLTVKGTNISGVNLVLASLPAISGRLILDDATTAQCVKRRNTALQETMIVVRRQKQTSKSGEAQSAVADQVPLTHVNQIADAVPDAKGEFVLQNLRAGTYRLNVQFPSSGWYLRSVALGANIRSADSKVIGDGISLKSQSVSGLTLTFSEGAASIRGFVAAGEGQRLPQRMTVYLIPAEKDSSGNLLRYFETRAESDGAFTVRNIAPGDYSVVALTADADKPAGINIREDPALRMAVVREAEKVKQPLTLKLCERLENFELSYSSASKP